MNIKQPEIIEWFDHTYKRRGFGYLRPQEAYHIFLSILRPVKKRSFLDVGCGPGLLMGLAQKQGLDVYGVDISNEAVNMARKFCPEAKITKANAEDLPFEDNSFDYLTCIGSFERMINRSKAIAEQIRVAKENAKFCYMVRNADHLSWKYFLKPFNLYNQKGHQEALSYHQWIDLFSASGLRVIAVYPDHWPYYRLRKSIPGWNRNIDYSKIRTFPFNLKRSYEFIFLLEKDEGNI